MGTTLILCEKPSAAQHIAEALSAGAKYRKITRSGVPYFEVEKKDGRLIVCCALGHLYEVSAKAEENKRSYPVWDLCWMPKHQIDSGYEEQTRWIRVLGELAEDATDFVNACDYDVEGSLIGYMTLRFACGGVDEKAKRMRFSTLTRKDILASYSQLLPTTDFTMADAGRCRHEVDFLYGINLSRALTQSANQQGGRYLLLSMGRVQGPTLRFIVEREKEIRAFVPIPYWTIHTLLDIDGKTVEAEYEKPRIENVDKANDVVADCSGKEGVVTGVSTMRSRVGQPPPFDLTALQTEAYRHSRLSPSQTLAIAERLYLAALISYPRTSSQKFPPTIGYREILESLAQNPEYAQTASTILGYPAVKPVEGEKTDPAHPAIYPTGVPPHEGLDARAGRLYDLIVKRFLATFGECAEKESLRATLEVDDHTFFVKGSRVVKEGWTAFYRPYAKVEETLLPPLREGQKIQVKEITALPRSTSPPPRFNPSSLLSLMEDQGIGTKATRAGIIETLYRRKYIANERIEATPLSFDIVDLMLEYCPLVIDVSFTRLLESKMQMIEENKIDRGAILLEAIRNLHSVLTQIRTHEQEIGRSLVHAMKRMQPSPRALETPCPQCGSRLVIIRSKKTGKRFITCTGRYEKGCGFSLPLPQRGRLGLTNKRCSQCGFQIIFVTSASKRSFTSCPKCYCDRAQRSTHRLA